MANISLKRLFEAEDFQAKSKQTGKLVHFKSKDAYQAALKAGTHEDPKAKKGDAPKTAGNPNDMFGGDYAKDRGGDASSNRKWVNYDKYHSIDTNSGMIVPKGKESNNPNPKDIKGIDSIDTPKAEKSKYDDKEYWKDAEFTDTRGGYYDSDDEDSEEYDDYDDDENDVRLTSDRLSRVETALEGDLDLRGNGFETTRESSGGGGGWEGPMTIVSKDADYNSDDYISLSVGSPNNDGKFSIVFANANGEPHFEPNYDALTGDNDLEPQQAYKVTKALMKMPEVQKVLKGEMKLDEFKPIYDKLKSKFSKTESTKLTSMIKK